VRIAAPTGCPVAEACGPADATGYVIGRGVPPEPGGRVIEEVAIDAEAPVDDERLRRVFAYDSESVYRFDRPRGMGCPCERVERFGCPVVDVRAEGDALVLTFHALDTETLRDVVTDLRAAFTGVSIRRLIQSDGEDPDPSQGLVLVDRGRLTDRQYEVLATAQRMGYFEYPKRANAGEVAAALGIARATFTEHLAAAQSKLLQSVLAV